MPPSPSPSGSQQQNGDTEQTPLLNGDTTKPIDHGTLATPEDAIVDDTDHSGKPLVPEQSTLQIAKVLGVTWIGAFLAALDSTIVATLSSAISTSFHSLSLLSWLASAYFIANAALQPLSGKLTDIYGRRAGLIFSNIFFCAGNLICGLAKDEATMIAGRVVAGMGGGGLTAIGTFVASDMVPLRRRGIWQGFGNICYGMGAALGGVFGGAINDSIGWRWAFLIQVPLTVISGVMIFFVVKIPARETDEARIRRVDFLGGFVLIAMLVTLLLGLNSGGNIVSWTHPLVLTTLPISGVLLALFIYIEAFYATEPIIPVRLLLNRTILSACLCNWFVTMSCFGLLFYGPIYFQVRGMSATDAGIRMIPQSVGVAIGSVSCGAIMRKIGKYYMLNIAVQSIFVLSLALICTFDLQTPVWPPFIYFFLTGIGYSGMLTVTLLALIAAIEHQHQAVITSASYAFRSTGSTIGITISSAVFQNILKDQLWSRFGDRKNATEIIPRVRDSLDEIKNLPESWKTGVMEVYMDALRGVFVTLLGIGIIGGMASLFMREHRLHSTLARRDS